jgi:hypothetical protein
MNGLRLLLLGLGLVFLRPRPAPPAVAPEVRHSSWKALYPAIADTITLHFGDDSSVILSSTGVPILQSTFKLKNDLVIFHDVGGMNACHDMAGSYHVKISGDTLVLVIDEDPCDTRAGMMILKPWIRKR